VPHPECVELLPYHELALGKYRALGRTYPLKQDAVPLKEELEKAKAVLEQSGLAVKLQQP
jgi:pyruvate formate lyase activating enzyme